MSVGKNVRRTAPVPPGKQVSGRYLGSRIQCGAISRKSPDRAQSNGHGNRLHCSVLSHWRDSFVLRGCPGAVRSRNRAKARDRSPHLGDGSQNPGGEPDSAVPVLQSTKGRFSYLTQARAVPTGARRPCPLACRCWWNPVAMAEQVSNGFHVNAALMQSGSKSVAQSVCPRPS